MIPLVPYCENGRCFANDDIQAQKPDRLYTSADERRICCGIGTEWMLRAPGALITTRMRVYR